MVFSKYFKVTINYCIDGSVSSFQARIRSDNLDWTVDINREKDVFRGLSQAIRLMPEKLVNAKIAVYRDQMPIYAESCLSSFLGLIRNQLERYQSSVDYAPTPCLDEIQTTSFNIEIGRAHVLIDGNSFEESVYKLIEAVEDLDVTGDRLSEPEFVDFIYYAAALAEEMMLAMEIVIRVLDPLALRLHQDGSVAESLVVRLIALCEDDLERLEFSVQDRVEALLKTNVDLIL